MKNKYYIFLAVASTIISCKNDVEEPVKADPRLITPFTQQIAAQAQKQSEQQAVPSKHNLFSGNDKNVNSSVLVAANPAHGQPNHRCDIAVGAPLNSVSNGTIVPHPAQTQTQTQVQNTVQPAVAKTITPKGMNPPHGEKNHRCDIAVGAPLNSKPAAVAAPAVPAVTSGEVSKQISVDPSVPALLKTGSAPGNETPAGINPAHGQPNHRCDIAVGAPLPKS